MLVQITAKLVCGEVHVRMSSGILDFHHRTPEMPYGALGYERFGNDNAPARPGNSPYLCDTGARITKMMQAIAACDQVECVIRKRQPFGHRLHRETGLRPSCAQHAERKINTDGQRHRSRDGFRYGPGSGCEIQESIRRSGHGEIGQAGQTFVIANPVEMVVRKRAAVENRLDLLVRVPCHFLDCLRGLNPRGAKSSSPALSSLSLAARSWRSEERRVGKEGRYRWGAY